MTATDVNLTGGAVFDEKSATATPIRADDPSRCQRREVVRRAPNRQGGSCANGRTSARSEWPTHDE